MWCATGKRTSKQVSFMNDDQGVVEKAIDSVVEHVAIFWGKLISFLVGIDYIAPIMQKMVNIT